MINGSTKKVGVMGWPISHTMSPCMHNAAFAATGLDYVYVPCAVKPEDLSKAVTGLSALGFTGMNVTIPHKVSVMQYLDEIEPHACLIGAVNTISIIDGRLIGSNTDSEGFIASLLAQGVNPKGMSALLLGAGGAARAVICGLAAHGVRRITVAAREIQKVRSLAADFCNVIDIAAVTFSEKVYEVSLQTADLIINCTPLGMEPKVEEIPPVLWSALRPSAVVCDLVYKPIETRLIMEAKERGHQTIGGLGMLIEQGAMAFEKWTGSCAPREVMAKAVHDKLCEDCIKKM